MNETPYWTGVINEAIERERRGEVPFDWQIRVRAGGWPTCACGEMDPRIERNERGRPLDDILCGLGLEFCRQVEDQDPLRARKIMAKIEKREGELLADGPGAPQTRRLEGE